ncbi:MAG: hypothetical protein ACK4OP_14335, partial [Gemmobacter sp.]
TRRFILRGDAGPAGVRLWRFTRAAPGVSATVLHAALRAAPPVEAARAQERFEPLDMAETGIAPIFDAAETFWFDDAGAALDALRSAAMRERVAATAGLIRGTEHLLARVHVVPVAGGGPG